jgi:hypothetical protein
MKIIKTTPVIVGYTMQFQLDDGIIASVTYYNDDEYPPEIDVEGRDLTTEELDEIRNFIEW